MLNFALRYLNQGLSVIPLRPKGKEPLISWTEYQQRCPTESELVLWWTTWPSANIGLVTGKVSGCVVVDLDGPEGLRQASLMKLSSSVISSTGHGKHLWYRNLPLGVVTNAVRIAPGIDIRGEGGYIVAPPSIHPNGRRYRFINPFTVVDQLPAFPAGLLRAPVAESVTNTKSDSWIDEALEDFKNGHVSNTLVAILGKFRAHNFSENAAFTFLKPHNISGKLSNEDLQAKIEEIWDRYESNETKTSTNGISGLRSENQLVIHSPANPESWSQFHSNRGLEHESSNPTTGYTKLDSMLLGGLKSSRLFTIAARTGVGKTNFLLAICKYLSEQGKRTLLFSTEMPYTQIWSRYLALLPNSEQFKGHQFFVCDSFAPNLERVEEAIAQIKPDIFAFDHINHVSEETKELGAFMQGLNFLRRKYDCAGIVTAQLNRAADWVDMKTGEKVVPRMSMIKGSGTIEQASSRVLLLSETRVTDNMTEIVGNLDKNDNGPKGLIHFGLMSKPVYRMVEL